MKNPVHRGFTFLIQFTLFALKRTKERESGVFQQTKYASVDAVEAHVAEVEHWNLIVFCHSESLSCSSNHFPIWGVAENEETRFLVLEVITKELIEVPSVEISSKMRDIGPVWVELRCNLPSFLGSSI